MNNTEITKPFFSFLNKFDKLSEEEFQQIAKYIRVRRFTKNHIITNVGEIENYFYFIVKGLVRKYYIQYNQEFNVQISCEGHIIHSQVSFFTRKPSSYIVKTIESCLLISIHYDDLEKLYKMSKKMERMGRLIVTHALVLKDSWSADLTELTLNERFIKFINNQAELVQRVPQKILASYLNMRPETFSRLKHLTKPGIKKT